MLNQSNNRTWWDRLLIIALAIVPCSCIGTGGDYKTVAFVDLPRFMGDWYVQGHTPVFFDKDSSDQRESYRLDADGGIVTEYTFKKNGSWNHYLPYGRVYQKKTNAHWKMQFLWPFSSDFLIVGLAPDYGICVISVPDKDQIWIMSRERHMSDLVYQSWVDELTRDGYATGELRRVPQGTEPIQKL